MAKDLSPAMIEAFRAGVVNQQLPSSNLCVDWYFERVAVAVAADEVVVRIRASVTFDVVIGVVEVMIVPELD